VTKKGYYYEPANGQIDFHHPDIKLCLDEASDPVTTVGFLVAALEKRMNEGTKPFTVMSCDNLTGNGNILRNVVLAYAGLRSEALRDWIATEVTFPNTMVDRIVPETTHRELERAQADFGIDDLWPIYTEHFRQFIIEEKFCNDRPDFHQTGVQVVGDVVPFEKYKLRILNGSHMALGAIGFLSGYKSSEIAISDESIKNFISGLMDEMLTTLPLSINIDPIKYKNKNLERILAIPDDLQRLARNGSQKVESRFLEPLRDAISKGESYKHIAFAIAGWLSYLKGGDESRPHFIFDDEAIRMGLQRTAQECGNDASALLASREIFGADLSSHYEFTDLVKRYFKSIEMNGMANALSRFEHDKMNEEPSYNYSTSHPDLKL
jgi:mannitol-1-phosphate/altronate dehydrogenase